MEIAEGRNGVTEGCQNCNTFFAWVSIKLAFKNYRQSKENERKGGGNSSNLEAKDIKEKIIQLEVYNHRLFNTV